MLKIVLKKGKGRALNKKEVEKAKGRATTSASRRAQVTSRKARASPTADKDKESRKQRRSKGHVGDAEVHIFNVIVPGERD